VLKLVSKLAIKLVDKIKNKYNKLFRLIKKQMLRLIEKIKIKLMYN